jgi:CRP/FNR family transcriptional regulator
MPSILSSISYFSNLNADVLSVVEQSTFRKIFLPEQVALLEGSPDGGLFIVERGWLKVVKFSTGGREQVLNFLGPGDVFNGVAVFTESVNQASVIALEESMVWIISRATMLNLLDTHPMIARSIIHDLAGRLQHLVSLVEDLSLRSIESRLARTLLEGTTNNTIPRRKWATQNEMAARLGTVPDVLNRALRKLVEEGLISVARHQIVITDPEGLRAKIDAG